MTNFRSTFDGSDIFNPALCISLHTHVNAQPTFTIDEDMTMQRIFVIKHNGSTSKCTQNTNAL